MKERFWGTKQSPRIMSIVVRLGLATAAIAGSILLGWLLISSTHHAQAANPKATSTSTPLQVGPVNTAWYFAEGRVGKSFREYLTIGNPTPNACAVNIQYNYVMDGSTTPLNKTVAVQVAAASRLTESVNGDLGIADSSTSAASVATVVTVNKTSTPNCQGIVVERPMYFTNFQGIASGTDVFGATKLGTKFYFADVPSGSVNGSNFTSYITILNPNNTPANVQVIYPQPFAALQQTLTVPAHARGTIAPSLAGYTGHMPAIVTSTNNVPIMVERPTYFSNVNNASGAYDVVGQPALANDWFFAEGYTGPGFQEYLTIANLDPTSLTGSANVTILLKSQTGVVKQFTLTLHNNVQQIWDVNANNTFAGSTPQVSAEVQSTGQQIIVQREIYFTYKHTLPTAAIGGTDTIGQVGPATHNIYSFAEGYAARGYNEWLTIQNPTQATESITVTLLNGNGQTFSQSFNVVANSRYTLDIAALVQTAFNPGTSSTANSVSMTVQTLNGQPFIAERPMYFNTNGVSSFGVQGGSSLLGYVGG